MQVLACIIKLKNKNELWDVNKIKRKYEIICLNK